jgi:hypothetical protein
MNKKTYFAFWANAGAATKASARANAAILERSFMDSS